MRLALVLLLAAGACCYIEVVEETHCHNTEFRLTCRHLNAHLAILQATFTPNTSCAATYSSDSDNSTDAPDASDIKRLFRRPLNHRCSGKNVCSFRLIQDHPPSESWGPGLVYVKYACMEGVNMSRYCTQDVVAHDEGFLQTPAYPSYYVGQQECKWTVKSPPGQKVLLQLLDVSLRGIAPREANCTDHVTVVENDRTLLSTCGDEEDLIQILSETNTLEVTITTASKKLFPKRGVLAHYKAIGCVHPPPPHDGYVVYKNETFGEYMCCVGYAFPDTLEKTRVLQCINNNTWNNTLPDCTNTTNSIWGPLRLHTDNNTEVIAIIKDSDLLLDVLLPTVIICVLLVGNGVIISVIYYLRKRKLPRHLDEEEVGAIYQPNDTSSEKAISV